MQVTASSLTFGYRGPEDHVLSSWTGTFETGRVTALTGPSGSGKSTLLYLLALMLRPDAGDVFLDGLPVAGLPDASRARLRARRAGFVFQDALLDASQTVISNVLEGGLFCDRPRSELRARAEELLERFEVGHRGDHRPGEISGGQAQRVALCRALVTDPEVVFADEPTGNLDRATASVVLNAFQTQARSGATVIVATHDPFVVDHCDAHVVLDSA